MRPRPALVRFEARHGDAAAAHPDRVEQIAPDRLLIGHVGDARDHLARCIIGDVLIVPAGAGRADGVERRKLRPEQARVLTFLELVGISVAVKAQAVREQVADRRFIFVAGGQLEVRRVIRDRRVEVDLALLGKLGDHRRREPLGAGSPAEHRLRRDRIARAVKRLAIALEEGDSAVLDHAHRKPDHRRLGHQLPEASIEQPIIDVAPRRGWTAPRASNAPPSNAVRWTSVAVMRPHRQQRRAHQQHERAKSKLLCLLQNHTSPHPSGQLWRRGLRASTPGLTHLRRTDSATRRMRVALAFNARLA